MCVHPGATTSTADVYNGLVPALERLGHTVIPYRLDSRITYAGGYLYTTYETAKKNGMELERPTSADVLWYACSEAALRFHHHKCDWMVVISSMYFPRMILQSLRRANVKVAVVLTESPYDDNVQERYIDEADVVFTNERSSLKRLRAVNRNTHYLRQALDPATHFPAPSHGKTEVAPEYDAIFVGTGFQERIDMLKAVNWDSINVGLFGSWTLVGERSKLQKYIRGGEVKNTDTAALYRAAKIGINIYRRSVGFGRYAARIDHAESMNLREYELSACGLFHISEERAEATELFGDALPTFSTAEELEEQLRYWLGRPAEERQEIAEELQRRVQGHTWDKRAKELISHLRGDTNVEVSR